MRLPGFAWQTVHRTQNRWHDLRAILAGYCNDCPRKRGLPDEGDGYIMWRCALKRGHDGLHRSRNYVWDAAGAANYLPVPPRRPMPSQPWDRNGTPTMRQTRNLNEWHRKQDEKRAALRRARRDATQ